MTENKTPQEKLIEKFKGEPFSIIDERGTILNKTHLSSMGYATHVPYSVVGLDDLLTSINKLAHEKDELEKENEQLKKENSDLKVLVKDLVEKGGLNKHILKVINGDVE